MRHACEARYRVTRHGHEADERSAEWGLSSDSISKILLLIGLNTQPHFGPVTFWTRRMMDMDSTLEHTRMHIASPRNR